MDNSPLYRVWRWLGVIVFPLYFMAAGTAQPPDTINPVKYLPTVQFDGTDNFDNGEFNYPQRIDFNTTQDANGDSIVDAEDAMENLIRYSIGDSLYGTGRTGLPNRGPNDQRPAVYFQFVDYDSIHVYEYWYYYADNDWINNHEYDLQYMFIYVQSGVPTHVLFNYHIFTNIYRWSEVTADTSTHVITAVEGGSHGFLNGTEDGVQIRYNGQIDKRNGYLDTLTRDSIPWLIFSNDTNTINTISYVQQPDTFYAGDDDYPFPNPCEWCDPRTAPWEETYWTNPPLPPTSNCPLPQAKFSYTNEGLTVQFNNSSENATDWEWHFGDGATDTVPNPTHTYDTTGSYRVCLTVTDSCGDRVHSTCHSFTCTRPSAAFDWTKTQNEVDFTNQSQQADYYFWMFGDENTSTAANPIHQYSDTGTYQTCLIAFSDCLRDTMCQTVQVTSTGLASGTTPAESLKVFPDSRQQQLTLFMPPSVKEHCRLQIINVQGQVVKSAEREGLSQEWPLSFSPGTKGLYIIRLQTEERVMTEKFVWQ